MPGRRPATMSSSISSLSTVRGVRWIALLALIACGPPEEAARPSPAATQPTAGGQLVVATAYDIRGVNPLLHDDTQFTNDVLNQLYLSLFEERPDYQEHPPTFEPELAESWAFSDDRRTLTVRLRPDRTWSDGRPITAEDVRWTWERQIDPEIAWSYAQSKGEIESVTALDPLTVEVRFRRAYAGQLFDLNEGFVLPRHAWEELPAEEWRPNGDWFLDHLVTSGPFRLASWTPQQEIVLERSGIFPEPDRPLLDRVVFRIVPDKSAQLAQLVTGVADVVDFVPREEVERLAADPGIRLHRYWGRSYTYLGWNTAREPFDDPQVRRALTLATDRTNLVETLFGADGRVGVSPLLTTVWAHDPDLEPWDHDPDEARRLLAAAGFEDGDGDGVLERDGRDLSFEIATNGSSRLRVDALVMIQEQLRRVGVEVRPRQLELNALNEKILGHDFDAAISGWSIDTSLDLSYAFHSDSIANGYNFVSYSNPRVDELLDRARDETEPEALARLLREVEQILHVEQPYTFLWESKKVTATSDRVRDATPNALTVYYDLDEWWVAPAGP